MQILIFGDSITQGFHDLTGSGWANRLHAYAMNLHEESKGEKNYSVFNLGISGDCTNRLLERFEHEAEVRVKDESKNNLIIFAVGVNDTQRYISDNHIKTPMDVFKDNLEELHKKATNHTNIVVFLGILPIREEVVQPMPWADDRSHYSDDIKEYDKAIADFCSQNDSLFIPMQDIFDNNLENYLPDGIHPNAKGHQLIYERVISTLKNQKHLI